MATKSPFPINAALRRQLDPDGAIFNSEGRLAIAGIRGARHLALELNRHQGADGMAKAGAVHALELLHRVLGLILLSYRNGEASAIESLLLWLQESLGDGPLDAALLAVAETYPPADVFAGRSSAQNYLAGHTDGVSHRILLLEEMLLIAWINRNPGFEPLRVLFDDRPLKDTVYSVITDRLLEFLSDFDSKGDHDGNLHEVFEEPLLSAPESLLRQVEMVATYPLVSVLASSSGAEAAGLTRELLVASDLLREEEKVSFVGPGPVQVPVFSELEGTPRRMAVDAPWMGSAVLGAKLAHVWIHQLQVQYGITISGLHDIPREALADLVKLGWTDLWLIGIWERSPASRQIKRLCGNPEAEASAYSLLEYRVAKDLGGEEALSVFEVLAQEVGLRLATDMVPNHTGIDSCWVMERPEYFLALDESPFPSYSFEGPDLSHNSDVSIHLEDHYYDRTDAAVVFRRTDHRSGDVRFIYHGNDGTGLPWSDTAQLNYLNPEVREAVIEQIIAVARRFPVVRFDAAMTLTLQHFHRLWYPEPGTGGDIASRAEHGVDKEVFLALMPEEFWWEVAQRLRTEAPNTLLVAEAFWLLEGYFVRSLGIHRVYNSAFMHMLREGNGSSLRQLLRAVLLFDPAILARFVNFLSNPDEQTARQQFGSGSKYFAAASLLATLPGTPMFAHGQIGGLSEKYGMEYRRPYRKEEEDPRLVARHLREIVPLLQFRSLFSGSQDFELFDFLDENEGSNEAVIAFTNRNQELSVLVLCNYSNESARGLVGDAAPRSADSARDRVTSLLDAMGLDPEERQFVELEDPRSPGPITVDTSDLLAGRLAIELGPYQTIVFTLRLLEPVDTIEAPGLVTTVRELAASATWHDECLLDPLQESFTRLLLEHLSSEPLGDILGEYVELSLPKNLDSSALDEEHDRERLAESLNRSSEKIREKSLDPAVRALLACHDLLTRLADFSKEHRAPHVEDARAYLEAGNLGPSLATAATFIGFSHALAQDLVTCLRALLAADQQNSDDCLFDPEWLHDPDVRGLLRVHKVGETTWFRREGLERMLWARFLVLSIRGVKLSRGVLAELLLVEEVARLADYRLEIFSSQLVI